MEGLRLRMKKRQLLAGALAACAPRAAMAFGQDGAFHARALRTSGQSDGLGVRETALAHWGWELVRRTSSPARLHPSQVQADAPSLLHEPFCVWAGAKAVGPLSSPERRQLTTFFQLGGVLLVDESEPERGEFLASARDELKRVLPSSPVVELPRSHVLFKSYYLVEHPPSRVSVAPVELGGMFRGRQVQVLFSNHDLLGALARTGDTWALPMAGGSEARQWAVRLCVNVAMYVLCSDYKDDQVHAQELMRRRGRSTGHP